MKMLLRFSTICLLSWLQFPSQTQAEVLSISGPTYVWEWDEIYMECRHTGDESGVHVYKGEEMEELVEIVHSVWISHRPGSVRVVIYEAQQDDSGPYSCGEDRSNVKSVMVHVVPGGTVVKAYGNEQVWPGCPLRLHCEVIGEPSEVVWYKDGVSMGEDTEGMNPLHVPHPTVEDSGLYECKTPTNSTGSIRVQVWPDEGTTVEINGTGHVAVGCPLRLTCQVQSDPKEVTWYKDDVAIDPNLARTRAYCSYPPFSVLNIRSVSRSDAGQYECRTQSGAAQTFPVHVSEDEIKPSGVTAVQVGEALELSCEASGQAECVNDWWKNGVKIDSDRNPGIFTTSTQISDSTALTSLRIPRTTPEDDGFYTCGTQGGSFHTFRVHIGGGEEVQISGPEYVVDGDMIQLACEVTGSSASEVTWYHDTAPLVYGVTHFAQEGTLTSFMSRSASTRHAGMYYCRTPAGATASMAVHVFQRVDRD